MRDARGLIFMNREVNFVSVWGLGNGRGLTGVIKPTKTINLLMPCLLGLLLEVSLGERERGTWPTYHHTASPVHTGVSDPYIRSTLSGSQPE